MNTSTEYKDFTVRVTPEFPAWNERDGWTVQVRARSKREAIKAARQITKNNGDDVADGRFFYRTEG